MIDEARTSGAKVHFASLMDICRLKDAELEATHPQIQRWGLYSVGDTVKDDSGSYSVFTEHSYKSWMSSPDCRVCDGQAADTVSVCTQVKMEDSHKLLKIPKSECPDTWIRLPRANGQNHGPVW